MVRTRREVPVKVYRLGEEPSAVEDEAHMTPTERINGVWEITQLAWAFRGEEVPPAGSVRHHLRVVGREH